MQTKAFISWSGGKDCSLALCYFLKNPENKVLSLVNIKNSVRPEGYPVSNGLLSLQSEALGIPIILGNVPDGQTYEQVLKSILAELKTKGVNAGVFGDIYLMEHRVWIERVCREMGIRAVFPLWDMSSGDVMDQLIESGFETIIVAVRNRPELLQLLGRTITKELVEELKQIEGIDICGENGEYHSFVFNSPLYDSPIGFTPQDSYTTDESTYLPLSKQ